MLNAFSLFSDFCRNSQRLLTLSGNSAVYAVIDSLDKKIHFPFTSSTFIQLYFMPSTSVIIISYFHGNIETYQFTDKISCSILLV